MLRELHVRGLGVLHEVHVAFAPGLNVLTGETGAGKTLLITSLGLLGGARAPSRLVAPTPGEAWIEAIFDPPEGMRERLEELGAGDDELIVARRIGSDGRSRAWVGGSAVPVSVLGEILSEVLEIHGQGSGFALARPGVQLAAVDALSGQTDLAHRCRTAVRSLREAEAEREQLAKSERERARQLDYLRFQAEEIHRADLRPDEDTELTAEIRLLEHADRLASATAMAASLASSEGAAGQLAEARAAVEEAAGIDPTLASLAERLAGAEAEAVEAARELRAWSEGLEPDPERLAALHERAALISSLKRKYGDTIEAVVRAGAEARARVADLVEADERLAVIDAEVASRLREAEELAAELSETRRVAAAQLTRLVSEELPHLALRGATFDARCEPSSELTEHGRDRVSFLFSAHPSRPVNSLGKIASGGELSRTMIAITLALAANDGPAVLVFDEADQGVGGAAALELGRRLARLGTTHQVLVVSHLPQIAAFASHHIAVRASSGSVGVEILDDRARVGEISRMLAGLGSSDTARAHASELVAMAAAERAELPLGV